jgi:hypothetical protein
VFEGLLEDYEGRGLYPGQVGFIRANSIHRNVPL